MRSVLFLALALLLAAPAAAQNLALVLTNSVYASGPAPERFARVASAVDRLRARGFEVISGQDLAAADMRAQLGGLFDRMQQDGAERVVIVLAGRMVQSQSGSWLPGSRWPTAPGCGWTRSWKSPHGPSWPRSCGCRLGPRRRVTGCDRACRRG